MKSKTNIEMLNDILSKLTYTEMERFAAFLKAAIGPSGPVQEIAHGLITAAKKASEDLKAK